MLVALSKSHNKKVTSSKLLRKSNLHGTNSTKVTLLLEFETNLSYNPGDHVGIFAKNSQELVDKILERLTGINDANQPMELQILKETHTSNGK